MARGKWPSPTTVPGDLCEHPPALTVGFFTVGAAALAFAAWRILRNLRRNEPGLTTPVAFATALVIATSGVAGAERLGPRFFLPVATAACLVAASLFLF